MSINTDRISLELNGLAQRLNVRSVFDQTITSKSTQLASSASKLGLQVNQVLGGMQALTQELDFPADELQSIASSAVSGLSGNGLPVGAGVVNRGIVMLADNPPGLTIKKATSSMNSDLEALTEESVEGGLLNNIITANTPVAISRALARTANVPVTRVQTALNEVLPQIPEITGQLTTVLGNVEKNLPIVNDLSKEITRFKTAMAAVVNPGGLTGVIANIINNLDGQVTASITKIVRNIDDVPQSDINAALLAVQQGNIQLAGNILSRYSDLSTTELETQLAAININIAPVTSNVSAPSALITSTSNPSDDPRTGPTIGSNEEILARLACIDREVTELVVSSTYTYLDEDPSADSITGWHFIIKKSGQIQQCMPLQTELSDSYVGNHTKYTVGILMVGGVNANRGADKNSNISHSTYNRLQWNSLQDFMSAFFTIYPYGQVVDAEQITIDGSRPSQGVDAMGIAASTFNRPTIIPVEEGSKSIADLQALMLEQSSPPGSSTPSSTTTAPVDY